MIDVLVVGAGFAGLYMVHSLVEAGFTVVALDRAEGVGGTWYWNRYPGARVDVHSLEYAYSFSDRLQREWKWSEAYAAQPEIEAYLNWVADELDLRRHIRLGREVSSMTYAEEGSTWIVQTSDGEKFETQIVVAATGCLSAPLSPDIPGIEDFGGDVLYTSSFPKDGFDFSSRDVAIIGTGSSGVQVIPEIARSCRHAYVLQRSAAYTRPSRNRRFGPGEYDDVVRRYPDIRQQERESPTGTVLGGALWRSQQALPRLREASPAERLHALDTYGWEAPLMWSDVMSDLEANRLASELYAEMINRTVTDPNVASALTPRHPVGCKRWVIDNGYVETFNQSNVSLIDLAKEPIASITSTGIQTTGGHIEADVLVLATGFDAMTGALNRVEIRGRAATTLRDVWAREGPINYLGLQVPGFPNLLTITGPGSPSVLVNMVLCIEQHVEWITECLLFMRRQGYTSIEATSAAAAEWVETVRLASVGSIRTHPSCNSWYLGTNVTGKQRMFLPYAGGLPTYRKICDQVTLNGYVGFDLR